MKSNKHFSILLCLLALTLAACGAGGLTTNSPDPSSTPIGTIITPAPTSTEVAIPSESESLVSQAIADLALRLQVTEEVIQAVSVEAVEWRDTSLGCPQPGMMYAQVVTPGYKLGLEAEGEKYWYHTDAGKYLVLCKDALPSEPILSVDDPTVKDGGPNQPIGDDVIIRTPSEGK